MGRLMAFDYGGKRTGIAVTDPLKSIATGLSTVLSKEIIPFVKNYIVKEEVELFIVGEPKQMDNTPSGSAKMVNHFVKDLQKNFPHIAVERVDERFTSKMASRVIAQSGKTKKERQKKELIDTISATIILQSYMESKNH
jgi:putative Holliday junction resolvase